MINEKKITKSGSITIPAYMRRNLGLEKGEKVKIEPNNNGDLILRRIIGSCVICGSNANLIKIDDKFICKACREKISSIK